MACCSQCMSRPEGVVVGYRLMSPLHLISSPHICHLASDEHESFGSCIVFQDRQLFSAFSDSSGFHFQLGQRQTRVELIAEISMGLGVRKGGVQERGSFCDKASVCVMTRSRAHPSSRDLNGQVNIKVYKLW